MLVSQAARRGLVVERLRMGGLRSFLSRLRGKPLGMASTLLILLLVLIAVTAPLVAPYDPYEIFAGQSRLAPSSAHLFGTDQVGRDVLSRIIWGSRISLWVGILAVGLGTLSGSIVGLVCGFWRGKIDIVVQRVMDSLMALPALVLAMAIVSVLGRSITTIMIAIAIVLTPGASRIVRGAVLSIMEEPYIEAIRSVGAQNLRILLRHVLPNAAAPIIVIASVWLGNAILIEASLSFLGLGTPPPTPSWGGMLSAEGRAFMRQAPWMVIAPGMAISLTVLAFNLFGDTLRDILDPRLRGRR